MTDPTRASSSRLETPVRIVALGGGTGLPNILRGLRRVVGGGDPESLVAVVTMTDDGGSSGRLRRSLGVPPPGDVRNCLVALAAEEGTLAGLFQHRYSASPELEGHTLGNLILAALAEQSGSFLRAVEISSRVLRTVGRILPSTLDDVVLEARLEDGSTLRGESAIGRCERRINRVTLDPPGVRPTPGVVESILRADLVVVGPGSLYTSLLPTLLVPGVAEALRHTHARVVLVANLVSERGEASDLELENHVEVLRAHAGAEVLDGVVVHDGPIDREILARYRDEGARPLSWRSTPVQGLRVYRDNLLGVGPKLRHDPTRTSERIVSAWADLVVSAEARAGR